jgi:Holliday junction DNA helicase RuvA
MYNVRFCFQIPQTEGIIVDQSVTLYTYMHWNVENGPSFFGFKSEFERLVFLLIIECPKIGPSLALNILSQLKPGLFLEAITSQNEAMLSSLHGIGAKKAEQLIVELKHKVQKLFRSGNIPVSIDDNTQNNFLQWQQVSEVLQSLNYGKQEISTVFTQLTKKYAQSAEQATIEQIVRSALSLLSKKTTKQISNE